MTTAADITRTFSDIYARKEWGEGSGPGSTPEFCAPLESFLARFIAEQRIRTICDLGCGDMQWMPGLVFRAAVRYIGVDCVPELITAHHAKYPPPQFQFLMRAITPELCAELPPADLYFIKDVLQHWPSATVEAFLDAFFAARPAAVLLTVNDCDQRSPDRASELGPTTALHKEYPPLNKYCPEELFAWGGKALYRLFRPATAMRPQSDADYTQMLDEYVSRPFVYPAHRFSGRGVVICAGGDRYFTNAYVAARILRMHGCQLPIQFWYLGPGEMDDEMRELVRPLGVECVDGYALRERYPVRTLNGWELKAFALIHNPFEEVIFLDADNVCVRNPEYLFDAPQFKETGAIFWPDYGRLGPDRTIWRVVGAEYRDEPEFESGQILIDKRRCWKALNVAMHFNEWSDFYYCHVHGDKETFHMAWRKLQQPYSMPARGIHSLTGTMCQHDFDGARLFQHRNMRKWQLIGDNERIADFQWEAECLAFLEDLRAQWSRGPKPPTTPRVQERTKQLIEQRHYMYVRVGYDFRPIELLPNGRIEAGFNVLERVWAISGSDAAPKLSIWDGSRVLAELSFGGHGMLHGQWLLHEKMPVLLLPQHDPAALDPAALACEQFEFFRPRLNPVRRAATDVRASTLVLTGATGALLERMAEITMPRMEEYAKRHGLDFATCDLVGSRPPSWLKVAGLFQGLWSYDRVLWLDADVLVSRMDHNILDAVPPDAWQAMVSHDTRVGVVPNCGVWCVTRRMAPLLHSIWMQRTYLNHGWWEQAAVMNEMGFTTDVNKVQHVRDTELHSRTCFLDATWNHHPRHVNNATEPRFRHITAYEDRLAELQRAAALLPKEE